MGLTTSYFRAPPEFVHPDLLLSRSNIMLQEINFGYFPATFRKYLPPLSAKAILHLPPWNVLCNVLARGPKAPYYAEDASCKYWYKSGVY